MAVYKHYIWILLLISSLFNTGYAQTNLDFGTVGSDNICAGSLVELVFTLDPPDANFFYNWTLQTPDDAQPQQLRDNDQNPGTGTGPGDEFSFVRINLTVPGDNIITAQGPGGIRYSQAILVTEAPNAGQDVNLFLCNKTGIISLFGELGGTPDAGGAWTYEGSPHSGNFTVGTDEEGIYTYLVTGQGPCPNTDARVIVRNCSNPDYDGDGVANEDDLDDDNDGILDVDENLACTPAELTPTQSSVDEDFGIGPPTQNNFVSAALTYQIGIPQDVNNNDGEYNVATATYMYNFGNQGAFWVSTDENNFWDGDDNVDGRYLAINMKTQNFVDEVIYEQTDLPVTPGVVQTLSMKITNLSTGVVPRFKLQIITPGGAIIEEVESVDAELANIDVWNDYTIPFTPAAGVEIVTLRLINTQSQIGNGNDVGIDNILLARLECDSDLDGVPNYIDRDSDNDGIFDAVEAGFLENQIGADGQLIGGVDPTTGIPLIAGAGATPINTDSSTNDNYLNLDSDGDGCSDANEAYFDAEADGTLLSTNASETQAYGIDPFDFADVVNFDGLVLEAAYTFPVDNDNDGTLDYVQAGGPDLNGNSIPDACEDTADNDEDGIPDGIAGASDLDDDNDGILDVNEYPAGITDDPLSDSNGTLLYLDTTNANFIDVNNDGVDDRFDFDLDGIINQFDVDSDNDGIYDHVEAGLALVIITDDYGQIGEDTDVDIANGLLSNAGLTASDFDNDGLPNFLDIDADGDGILDNYEAQPTTPYIAPSGVDADENGADDAYDNTGALDPVDTTAGTPDYLNEDSDGDTCLDDTAEAYDVDQDGVSDIIETGDNNGDGLDDAYEGAPLVAAFPDNHNPGGEVDYREAFAPIVEAVVADAVCNTASAPSLDLFEILLDSPSIDNINRDLGTWSVLPATATITDGVIEPSTLDADSYVFEYTISYGIDCEHVYTVSLEVIPEPFTGLENLSAIPACSSDTVFSLYDNLLPDGAVLPDINGDWTSADTTVLPATYDGTIDLTTIPVALLGTDITFNYRVGSATCFSDSDIVINLSANRNAGIADTSIPSICITETSTDNLFTYLTDAEAGGIWSSTDDTVTDFTDDSLGVINPSLLAAGVYTYTYELEAIGSCSPDDVTVEITIIPEPFTGLENLSAIPACSSDTAFSLYNNLLPDGTTLPDINGDWTSADTTVLPATYDGAIDLTTIPATLLGTDITFNYRVGSTTCFSDTDIVINLSSNREAGIADASIPPICITETSTDNLFTYLTDAEAGGTWSSTDDTVTDFTDDSLGVINPSLLAAGVYTYTYELEAIGSCSPDDVTVEITIIPEPFTGLENLSAIPACSSDTAFSLYNNLLPDGTTLPDINGDWTSADTTVLPATYDGTIDLTTIPAALLGTDITFNYRVGSTTCFSDTDIVINLSSNREAGIADVSIQPICITETSTDNLFTYLTDAEAGGTWSSTDDTVTDFTDDSLGVINPSLLAAGVYTYTYELEAIGNCSPDDATVEITIISEPFTGVEDLSVIPVCSSDTVFSLYNNLLPDGTALPDANGVWTSADTTVLPATYDGTIDLTTIPAALLGTDITFNYRVGSTTCFSDTDIVINLSTNRDAGDTPTPLTICSNRNDQVSLFDELDQGVDTDGDWEVSSETIDPWTGPIEGGHLGIVANGAEGLTPGNFTFTYTLIGEGSCEDATVSVNLIVLAAPVITFPIDPVCSIDKETYDVDYVSNDTWELTIAAKDGVSNIGNASVDVANSKIINIPEGVEIVLTARDSSGVVCEESFDVTPWSCPCDAIAAPVNLGDVLVCDGDINQQLSVSVDAGLSVNWYESDDTDFTSPVATNTLVFTPPADIVNVGGYTYNAVAFDVNAPKCISEPEPVLFTIFGIQPVDLEPQEFLCVDVNGIALQNEPLVIESEGRLGFTYQWYDANGEIPGETDADIIVNSPGTYFVVYESTRTNTVTGATCSVTSSSTLVTPVVEPSLLPLSLGTGGFSEFNSITATLENGGDPNSEYEYDLDGDIFQDSNVFENVSTGFHTVTVTDLNGCGTDTEEIYVIGFPKFFTPNGDSTNEFWNVDLDPNMPMDLNIFIYDRFGKLIQQVFPDRAGWDGTFAGKNMPSDDYWFIATMNETGETFASHFSLIR